MLVRRLRSDLPAAPGEPLLHAIGDTFGVLYAAPLALIGLVWLCIATDASVIAREWPSLLLVAALLWLFDRLPFFVIVEVRPGSLSDFSGSLSTVVFWTACLVFGPTAIWIGVLEIISYSLPGWRTTKTTDQRWNRARNTLIVLAGTTLASLIALTLYQLWGGAYPIDGLQSGMFGPALAITVIHIVLDRAVWLPYLLSTYDRHSPTSRVLARRFLMISLGLPSLAEPFAIIAAGLWIERGVGLFLFSMGGLFIVSWLAHQLSHAASRSALRSRELEQLEQLSQALLKAPPDASTAAADSVRSCAGAVFAQRHLDRPVARSGLAAPSDRSAVGR